MTEEDELRKSSVGVALGAVGAAADLVGVESCRGARPSAPRRIGRILPAALVLGALTATAATAAALLASDEVDQFARDASISRPAATEALREQGLLPALDLRLRSRLPDEFAGLWVRDDGVTFTVGIAAKQSPELVEAVQAAAAAVGIGRAPQIEWGLRASVLSLEREQHRIQRRIDDVNRGEAEGVQVEPDIRKNRLILSVPLGRSAKQARVVREIQAEAAVPMTKRSGTPRLILR